MTLTRVEVEMTGEQTNLRNREETDPLGNVVNTGEEQEERRCLG